MTADSIRVAVLADTHLISAGEGAGRGRRQLPEVVLGILEGADAVLHAGDVLDGGVLEVLAGYAPLHAVLGNNDHPLIGSLPNTLTVEFGGVRIGMIHDSGPTKGRAGRMHRRFPDCDAVVFGHSHAPLNEVGEDGQLLFNPGSPTQRRAQPFHSMGELRIAGGQVSGRIIRLD